MALVLSGLGPVSAVPAAAVPFATLATPPVVLVECEGRHHQKRQHQQHPRMHSESALKYEG